LELPVVSEVITAGEEAPYLAFFLKLDMPTVRVPRQNSNCGRVLNFTDKWGMAFDSESCQREEWRPTGVLKKSLPVDKGTLLHTVYFQC
jgi:hypothetical protein